MILPGFAAADRSTQPLRMLLRKLGYRTYGWKLGTNLGPTPYIIDGLAERFAYIAEREQQPISLVGWSLGGLYARSIARDSHPYVRQVITLGSPLRMSTDDNSAVGPLWDVVSPLHDKAVLEAMRDRQDEKLLVPATSIYTRTDGVVHWRACLEEKGPMSENIEVFGSHAGLCFNPSVAVAVADRLAQKVGYWRRFRPPAWAVGAFPRPANYRPDQIYGTGLKALL